MGVCAKGLTTLLAAGAVFALLSIPLIPRKVPRNPVHGYRTRTTPADERLRYAANAHFDLRFLIGSAMSAAVGRRASPIPTARR